jgi:hypothetical protein
MDSAKILKVMSGSNPWWKTGAVYPAFVKSYRRFAYHEAMKRWTGRTSGASLC